MRAADARFSGDAFDVRPLMVMDMVEHNLSDWGRTHGLTHRWRRWTGEAYWQVLSQHKGHMVRHMGSGLMMEFTDARHCVQAAFALNELAQSLNARADEASRLQLRTAAHLARYARGEREPDDRDMQLTSELAAWAGPGEVLVTAELRDRLANGLDADLEDMGQRVGPFGQAVHLFRAHSSREPLSATRSMGARDPRPGLAIIPFKTDLPQRMHSVIGELIADGVIARLSHSIGLRVIARQSTSAFRECEGLGEIEHHLGATFVMSGRYSVRDGQLIVTAELAEARSHALLWNGHLQHPVGDLLQLQSELLHGLARAVAHALRNAQVSQPVAQPLPRLDSNLLMLASISMGHCHSGNGFERGREALTELIARHPRFALPRAWLGMWHALNVVKGRSGQVARDVKLAHEHTQRALQAEPGNAMALCVEGYIQCQLLGSPERARRYLTSAIEANPSEPMAWLFKSLYSSMWDSGAWSVTEAGFACSLSPVDPLQYLFDLLMGNALVADHQLEKAIACARRSLRAHKHHVPTLRLLLTAQAELGRIDEGKTSLQELRAQAPELTVSSYLAMGSGHSPMRQRVAQAMRLLGLPES